MLNGVYFVAVICFKVNTMILVKFSKLGCPRIKKKQQNP